MATEPDRAPEPPEPAERLSHLAPWAWRVHWAAGCLAALLAGGSLSGELEGAPSTLAWALPLLALTLGTALVPELRYRRWRWEVREGEIDIQSGVITLRRVLVPMVRVQHVEMTRGPVERALGLATVAIHTAAGSHTIPLLHASHAFRIRRRIAELAGTEDDGD
jgi:membrane protein YdbS with pleckstrin-like domain